MQKIYQQELLELFDAQLAPTELVERLENYHYSDVSDALEQTTAQKRFEIYTALGLERTAEIFSYYENVDAYIGELEPGYAADLLEQMYSADAAYVLSELDEEQKDAIIELMEEDAQESVKIIESYDEEQIGSYMTDNFIAIPLDSTIKSAMSGMVREAGEHDNIFTLYVVDSEGKYAGAVRLKDLITARKESQFSPLVMTSYPTFYDDELMSDCIEKLKDYGETSIPVLNRKNEIVGVLTGENVIEATEEEFADDYAKLGGLTEEEETEEPVLKSIKKRIPWLVVLLFLGLAVSSVVSAFETVIAALPVVVFFQSMILGMAGNVGTQSLAVTIRNLSDVNSPEEKKRQRKVIFKELKLGFVNGLIIGLISFALVLVYLVVKRQEIMSGSGYVLSDALLVSAITGASMLASITLAGGIGTIFPLLLSKMHIDPAVASGPFITTVNDIVAVLVYYGLTFLMFMVII
ncbi:MAG: magnesium transporter [Clostridia bacterium]|nr:magnesium transporter [Clostridia bacterium]